MSQVEPPPESRHLTGADYSGGWLEEGVGLTRRTPVRRNLLAQM